MEKGKSIFCAWVSGDVENLNRGILKEEFSRFGNISKVFVAADLSFAKVYLDSLENLKLACNQLDGSNGWHIKLYKDDYKQKNLDHQSPVKSVVSRSHISTDQAFESASGNGNIDDMEEECIFAGDYVDVHGRPVEVLMGENGVLYVNLDDVRTAGFNIYKKESFANAIISKDVDMRHLENFLLNQARKYVLDMKKKFSEAEMLEVFERVTAKLQNKKSVGEFGEGRLINASPNSNNFTITRSNIPSTASRTPRELADNFKPSFSHFKKKSKPDTPPFGDRQNGLASRSYDRQNGEVSHVGDSQNRRNDIKGPRHSFSSFSNKTQRNDENRRKSNEPNTGFGDSNSTQMRKSRQSDDFSRNKQKAIADSSAHEELEEYWEGNTSSPLKPSSDTNSVASERTSLDIERTVLVPNAVYKVKVSYCHPEKKSLIYCQWMDNVNQIEEILLEVNTCYSQFPEIKEPVRNMFCLAFFEECWYRAVVLQGKKSGGAFVELMDYGNKEVIATPLREMSEELTKIPALSIRLAIHNANLRLNIEQELEVYVKKHYDDLTHLVEIRSFGQKLNEDPPSPPSEVSSDSERQEKSEPANKGAAGSAAGNTTGTAISEYFMKIPTSVPKLTNGENVMIVGYTDNKLILRNKETAKICTDIYSHLLEMEKKPVANPKIGQLVLCSRDGMDGVHRAIIKDIKNQMAHLEYVDYYGGDQLTIKSLKNADELLATYSSARIESPTVDWLKNITEKSETLLHNVIMNKTKLKVILDGPKFDLHFTENDITKPLSEIIEQLENSTKEEPKKPAPVAGSSEREPIAAQPPAKEEPPTTSGDKSNLSTEKFIKILYDNMPYVTADLGLGFYVCYSYNETNLTILPSQEVEKYLPLIDVTEPDDTVPYEAAEGEMCLAKFVESWCRAAVTDVDGENYGVLFVDFGNAEVVPKSDIRRFPRRFAEIPILGIQAYLIGIPNESHIDAKLKQLIPDEAVLEIDVKVDINEALKYGIDIPSIYAQLQQEKLI